MWMSGGRSCENRLKGARGMEQEKQIDLGEIDQSMKGVYLRAQVT